MKREYIFFFIPILLLYFSCTTTDQKTEKQPPNVLMICVDDLRPELGCYGNEIIKSPNIDRFASEACVFKGHYVQAAVCGPSRATMLSGIIHHESNLWGEERRTGIENDSLVPIPRLFKKNGYATVCIGKISHAPGGVIDVEQKIPEIPFSWDTCFTEVGKWKTPWRAFFAYSNGDAHNTAMRIGLDSPHLPYERGDVGDDGYPDGQNALAAVKQLKQLKKGGKPFFLAVGFYKPHLPFNAPSKYWDMYNRDSIPPAKNNYYPVGSNPRYCSNWSQELTTHYPWPDGKSVVSAENAKLLKHGYYACVSYIDTQVGKVLTALKEEGLDKNTIVLLWSDHGWHLGEHNMWGKMTTFNTATNSPLIVKVPWLEKNGIETNSIVETVDIYPSLAELCGLKTPSKLDGESFVPILENPNIPGKPYARSYYFRNNALGKTIKTDKYRLVRWADYDTDSTRGIELYNHKYDFDENINVAEDNKAVTDSLLAVLKEAKFFNKKTPFASWWE